MTLFNYNILIKFYEIFERFVRLQSRIRKAVETLEFFTSNQWEFTNDNVHYLINEMNQTDNRVI